MRLGDGLFVASGLALQEALHELAGEEDMKHKDQ